MPGEYPKLIDQGWTHVISSVRPAPSAAYNQHYGQGQAYQYDPRTNDPRYGYPADPRYGYPADQRGYQGGGSTQGYRDRWYNPRDRGGGF